MSTRTSIAGLIAFLVLFSGVFAAAESPAEIIEQSKVPGGLVVVLGCPDNADLAVFRPSDSYVVQALDKDPAKVAAAREAIQAKGAYGPVSVDILDGDKLPYIDNLVNLLVVNDKLGVSEDEMKRGQDDLQELTDKYVAQVDEVGSRKEQDIMEI